MFGFPSANRTANFEFEKNLLKSITFQVMYNRVNVVEKKSSIVNILSEQFPTCKDLTANVFEFKNVNNVPQILPKPSNVTGIYFEATPQKVLQVNEDSISYTFDGLVYKNIETFWSEIKSNFFEVLKELGINEFNRVGLRKINVLKVEFGSGGKSVEIMSSVFNESLMATISSIPCRDYVNSTISNMSFKNGSNNLGLNFGLLPSNTSAKNLLLDIDNIFMDKVGSSSIEEKLMSLNNETFDIFNWALHKDELKKLSGK